MRNIQLTNNEISETDLTYIECLAETNNPNVNLLGRTLYVNISNEFITEHKEHIGIVLLTFISKLVALDVQTIVID